MNDGLQGKWLVLKFVRKVEWRTPIGDRIGDAINKAVTETGLTFDSFVDPTSIRFEIED